MLQLILPMQKVVAQFLALKCSISKKYCERLILSHPDYPSLLSIADTFERLGVDYRMSRTIEQDLDNFAYPYLLHFNRGNGELALIKSYKDLRRWSEDNKNFNMIVILAEVERIKDLEHEIALAEEKKNSLTVVVMVAVALGIFALLFKSISTLYLFPLACSIVGAVIGLQLVSKDLGISSLGVEAFCNASENYNCDKVLSSQGAKLFGVINLSEIVTVFFSTNALLIATSIIISESGSGYAVIWMSMSLGAIPFVIYSVVYQYGVLKAWCRLCLAVDFLLVGQFCFTIYILQDLSLVVPDATDVVVSALLAIGVGCSLHLVKSSVAKIDQLYKRIAQSRRIIDSPDVFLHQLHQEFRDFSTPLEREVLIGNRSAPVKFTMAINMYCQPCKDAHVKIERLIHCFPKKVSLAIRFIDLGDRAAATEYFLGYWLNKIHGNVDESAETQKLIQGWFSTMDLETFKKTFPMTKCDFTNANNILRLHYNWSMDVGIRSTPTIFMNGFKLPKNYSIEMLHGYVGIANFPHDAVKEANVSENSPTVFFKT